MTQISKQGPVTPEVSNEIVKKEAVTPEPSNIMSPQAEANGSKKSDSGSTQKDRQCAPFMWLQVKYQRLGEKYNDRKKVISRLSQENLEFRRNLRRAKNMNDTLLPLAAENITLRGEMKHIKEDLEYALNEIRILNQRLIDATGDVEESDDDSVEDIRTWDDTEDEEMKDEN